MEKVYYPYLKWYPPTPYYSLFFLIDQKKILGKLSYKVANLQTSHIVPKTQEDASGHGEKNRPTYFLAYGWGITSQRSCPRGLRRPNRGNAHTCRHTHGESRPTRRAPCHQALTYWFCGLGAPRPSFSSTVATLEWG